MNKLYPIQLKGIRVHELYVKAHSDSLEEEDKTFQLGVGFSEFDIKDNTIDVGVFVVIGNPDVQDDARIDSRKLDLKVHLFGRFQVDTSQFPLSKLDMWAEQNAPLSLYPYLREHVYTLSSHVLSEAIVLPLMQVPTLEVIQRSENNHL